MTFIVDYLLLVSNVKYDIDVSYFILVSISCFLASLEYLAELLYLLSLLEYKQCSQIYVTPHPAYDLSSFRKQIIVNLKVDSVFLFLLIQTINILIPMEKLKVILFQLFAQIQTVIKLSKAIVLLDIKSHIFFLYCLSKKNVVIWGKILSSLILFLPNNKINKIKNNYFCLV